jgi:hypothetical protein
MNTSNTSLLSVLEGLEGLVPLSVYPPLSPGALAQARAQGYPEGQLALWTITDGCEVNVPGTILWSYAQAQKQSAPPGWSPLGLLNFGDPLYLDRSSGRVIQVGHETGELFLDWPSLADFLRDELAAAQEEDAP